MWIIIADNREFGNRYDEIFLLEDEDGNPLQFDTFEKAEKYFEEETGLADTCSAKYLNMDE